MTSSPLRPRTRFGDAPMQAASAFVFASLWAAVLPAFVGINLPLMSIGVLRPLGWLEWLVAVVSLIACVAFGSITAYIQLRNVAEGRYYRSRRRIVAIVAAPAAASLTALDWGFLIARLLQRGWPMTYRSRYDLMMGIAILAVGTLWVGFVTPLVGRMVDPHMPSLFPHHSNKIVLGVPRVPVRKRNSSIQFGVTWLLLAVAMWSVLLASLGVVALGLPIAMLVALPAAALGTWLDRSMDLPPAAAKREVSESWITSAIRSATQLSPQLDESG